MANYHTPKKVSFLGKEEQKYKVGGYLKSSFHPKDKIRKGSDFLNKKFPAKIDLRPFMTKVEQQGSIGSCTANAMAGAYEYLAKRHLGEAADVSRLFVYYNAREEMGTVAEDSGATLRVCIEVLQKKGACAEATWQYDEKKFLKRPTQEAYQEAKQFLVQDKERIENNLAAWKSALAEGYPIAFGIELFESFDKVRRDGRVKVPHPHKEKHIGGHAMLCVGYLEKDQLFIVRNSWGKDWGDKGYCYIPYHYVLHEDFNDGDNWVIKNVTDLDFGKDVAIDDDESYFYDEGTLVIYDYYIRTEKVDAFLDKLEKLAEKYANGKDWGFEIIENEEDENLIELDEFFVDANDANGFLDELNVLSGKMAIDDDYDFQYVIEGEDFEDEENSTEKEEALSEDEDTESPDNENFVELYDFYIKTTKIDTFTQKLEELCGEYAIGGDFDYEVFEDEEEDNVFWFETFFIATEKPKEFLADLDKLCSQYAVNHDFDYEA